MINISLDIDATLTETGIDMHAWIVGEDLDNNLIHTSWSRLVSDLVEGHTIPSRGRRLSPTMNAGDYAYLISVMVGLREAAFMLEEQLDQVELSED
jgi:hypothetical protein